MTIKHSKCIRHFSSHFEIDVNEAKNVKRPIGKNVVDQHEKETTYKI